VTCKRTFRSLLLSVALSLTLGVAGVAATEPTVGGTLSAGGNSIHVFSNGNVPAHVSMTATDVTLSETSFDIQPGQTHDLTFTGGAVGSVSALYTTSALNQAGDKGSAQLTLRLIPGVTPPSLFSTPVGPTSLGYLLMGALLLLAVLFLLWRFRPWTYRLTRAP
jgi:hypothetical protein